MPDIGIAVMGDTHASLRFDEFPTEMHAAFVNVITPFIQGLEADVRAHAPDKTGRLRSEIESHVFADKPDRVEGAVYISGETANDFAKAGALEWGVHSPVKVGDYEMTLDHAWGDAMAAPTKAMIAAHTRMVDIPAERFLRGPFDAQAAFILDAMQEVVRGLAEKF